MSAAAPVDTRGYCFITFAHAGAEDVAQAAGINDTPKALLMTSLRGASAINSDQPNLIQRPSNMLSMQGQPMSPEADPRNQAEFRRRDY